MHHNNYHQCSLLPSININLYGYCSWKISLITPVPKNGEPSDPNNYHPISLLPVSKVLECITVIFNKLSDHLTISGDFYLEGLQQVP